MHRHLVHRLTVGFRVLQQNREDKVEIEHDTDLATSKYTSVLNYRNKVIHDSILYFYPDIETPVLGLSSRESFSFSPTNPGSPLQDFVSQSKTNQTQGILLKFYCRRAQFAELKLCSLNNRQLMWIRLFRKHGCILCKSGC